MSCSLISSVKYIPPLQYGHRYPKLWPGKILEILSELQDSFMCAVVLKTVALPPMTDELKLTGSYWQMCDTVLDCILLTELSAPLYWGMQDLFHYSLYHPFPVVCCLLCSPVFIVWDLFLFISAFTYALWFSQFFLNPHMKREEWIL